MIIIIIVLCSESMQLIYYEKNLNAIIQTLILDGYFACNHTTKTILLCKRYANIYYSMHKFNAYRFFLTYRI